MGTDHLERAREDLRRASDSASGQVQRQLDAIQVGISEEEEGDSTREEPGPKVDRLAEVTEKLDELEDRVEKAETGERIRSARDHIRSYVKNHPQGG